MALNVQVKTGDSKFMANNDSMREDEVLKCDKREVRLSWQDSNNYIDQRQDLVDDDILASTREGLMTRSSSWDIVISPTCII